MRQNRSPITLLFAIVLQLFCWLPGAARPGDDATSIVVSAGSALWAGTAKGLPQHGILAHLPSSTESESGTAVRSVHRSTAPAPGSANADPAAGAGTSTVAAPTPGAADGSGPLQLTSESQRVIEEQQSRLPLRKTLWAGTAKGLPWHGISALSPSSTNRHDPVNDNAALSRATFGIRTRPESGAAARSVLPPTVPATGAAVADPVASIATSPVSSAAEPAPGAVAEPPMGPEPPFNEISDEQIKEYGNAIKANKQFPTEQQIRKEVNRSLKTGITKAKHSKPSKKKKAARVIGRRIASIKPMLDALETDMSKARMLAGDETEVIGIEANLEHLRKRGISVLGDIKGAEKFSGTVMKHMQNGLKDARSHDNFKEKATRETLEKMQEIGDSMEYPKHGSDNPEYHHEPYSHRTTWYEQLGKDGV